jgi:beta-fructofuranosidase
MLKLTDRWIWDSWFVFDGENHHVFYLSAPRDLIDPNLRHRNPIIGHAVSADLVNWKVLPDAISPSTEPAFDSWTTWTGSVIKDQEGLWWMFYTGTSREDGGDIQRVGAATSSDLLTWNKVSKNALLDAGNNFYELLDYDKWHDQAFRDPWVFKHSDNKWHMLITARATHGEKFSRGVVGHATSMNLLDWDLLPPITEPNAGFGQLEVLQVEVIDGVPTLIWCCGTPELSEEAKKRYLEGGMFSVTGESVLGPFDLTKAVRFPHPSLYAARAVRHNGNWFMLGFINEVDGKFVGELSDPIPLKISGTGLTEDLG